MTEQVKPYSPADAIRNRSHHIIPQIVIEQINKLLAIRFNGVTAELFKDDVVCQLLKVSYTKQQITDLHLLDFEPLYRENGWSVTMCHDQIRGFYWLFTCNTVVLTHSDRG